MILTYKSPYFASLDLTAANAATIQTLISSTQQFVEKYCNRHFELTEYDELANVRQDGSVILRNFPVTEIKRICFVSDLMLTLQNVSDTVQIASYSVLQNGIRLYQTSLGVRTEQYFAWSDYATLGALKTAIEALEGWQLSIVEGYENYPSSDLCVAQNGQAKEPATITCWTDYQANYQFLPNVGVIEGIQNSWGYQDGSTEAWNSYSYYGGWGSFAASWGYYGGMFSRGKRVRVNYVGGFQDVPEPVKAVIAHLVITAYSSPEGRVKQESLGDYSYSLANLDECPASDKRVMAQYKDRRC